MVEGVNSSLICLIHCKNFCKCHNLLHPALQLKESWRRVGLWSLQGLSVCHHGFLPEGPREKLGSLPKV
jgi:hypothetical protein